MCKMQFWKVFSSFAAHRRKRRTCGSWRRSRQPGNPRDPGVASQSPGKEHVNGCSAFCVSFVLFFVWRDLHYILLMKFGRGALGPTHPQGFLIHPSGCPQLEGLVDSCPQREALASSRSSCPGQCARREGEYQQVEVEGRSVGRL